MSYALYPFLDTFNSKKGAITPLKRYNNATNV